ncbi:hypothetical protein SDC9_46453 [bioreactor metagenome]|uniref:Uncharacterized protein n=1 Tax=bioreactor metagenome TaxID=1076179 RepID=A0A644W8X5_9ZZZZ
MKSLPLQPKISARTSLDIGNADETPVFRVGRYDGDVAPPADYLDDRPHAAPAPAVQHRGPIAVLPDVVYHFLRLRIPVHDQFKEHVGVQETFLQKGPDKIARREPRAVDHHLEKIHFPSAPQDMPKGRKVHHHFHETDGGSEGSLPPDKKQDPDRAAAHIHYPGAENENEPYRIHEIRPEQNVVFIEKPPCKTSILSYHRAKKEKGFRYGKDCAIV